MREKKTKKKIQGCGNKKKTKNHDVLTTRLKISGELQRAFSAGCFCLC